MKSVFDASDPIYISTNTRAEAFKDGALIDVSKQAMRVGLRYSVAITIAVWEKLTNVPSQSPDDINKRLEMVLAFPVFSRRQMIGSCERLQFLYTLALINGKENLLTLKFCKSPGDHGEPVITIMLPMED